MPTLYLELNADRARESAARAEAAVRPLKEQLRALDETSNQGTAGLNNLAVAQTEASRAARELAISTTRATVASVASTAATRAQAFAMGILHRAWTTVTRALVITPIVGISLALVEMGLSAGKAALGLGATSDAADEVRKSAEAAAAAVERLNREQQVAGRLRAAPGPGDAIDAQLDALRRARQAFIAMEAETPGATMSVDEAAAALGGGQKGYLSARRFTEVRPRESMSGLPDALSFGTEQVVRASSVVHALNQEIRTLERSETDLTAQQERGTQAAKARSAVLAELVTGYNRLRGISAESEALYRTLTAAGVPHGAAAGAARGMAAAQRMAGGEARDEAIGLAKLPGGGLYDPDELAQKTRQAQFDARHQAALEAEAEQERAAAKERAEAARQTAMAEAAFARSASGFGSGFASATENLLTGMTDLGGAFQQFAQAIQQQIIRQLVTEPAGAAVGGWLASTFSPAGGAAPAASRLGNAFDGGIVPFAMGGVVSRPTMFAYGSGELGIMGEAGPEAVMPLRRGRDGRLGVEAARGGSPVVVNMRVTTPDPNAFRRSQGQLAARQAAAVRGAR